MLGIIKYTRILGMSCEKTWRKAPPYWYGCTTAIYDQSESLGLRYHHMDIAISICSLRKKEYGV